jgi:hypothetical protein
MPDPSNADTAEPVDLHPAHVACSHCGADLFRVDHSPRYADVLLYCTDCARRAEVAFDDPVYAQIVAQAGAEPGAASILRAVEQRLRSCVCGGRFSADAPRRCYQCDAVVIARAPAVDLWPGYCDFDMDQRMPPAEDIERINAFDASHIRRTDLWQAPAEAQHDPGE